MRRLRLGLVALAFAASAWAAPAARAADHLDGTAVKTQVDPSIDITDVFAWMSTDHTKVYLAMDVFPIATASSKFSPMVQYVFHVTPWTVYGGQAAAEHRVICTFDTQQKAQCWVDNADYITGDASSTAGITSTSGKIKLFAGLRDDPFFFNLYGFKSTAKLVHDLAATGMVTQDASGCVTSAGSGPPLTGATLKTAITNCLKAGPDGTGMPIDCLTTSCITNNNNCPPAKDFFQGLNVLAIVMAIDATLLTDATHPIISVWASTHKAQ
jgi:Domain of unknown function (DUF4331)